MSPLKGYLRLWSGQYTSEVNRPFRGWGIYAQAHAGYSPLLHRNNVVYLTFLLNEGSVNGFLCAYYMYCTLDYRLGPRYN